MQKTILRYVLLKCCLPRMHITKAAHSKKTSFDYHSFRQLLGFVSEEDELVMRLWKRLDRGKHTTYEDVLASLFAIELSSVRDEYIFGFRICDEIDSGFIELDDLSLLLDSRNFSSGGDPVTLLFSDLNLDPVSPLPLHAYLDMADARPNAFIPVRNLSDKIVTFRSTTNDSPTEASLVHARSPFASFPLVCHTPLYETLSSKPSVSPLSTRRHTIQDLSPSPEPSTTKGDLLTRDTSLLLPLSSLLIDRKTPLNLQAPSPYPTAHSPLSLGTEGFDEPEEEELDDTPRSLIQPDETPRDRVRVSPTGLRPATPVPPMTPPSSMHHPFSLSLPPPAPSPIDDDMISVSTRRKNDRPPSPPLPRSSPSSSMISPPIPPPPIIKAPPSAMTVQSLLAPPIRMVTPSPLQPHAPASLPALHLSTHSKQLVPTNSSDPFLPPRPSPRFPGTRLSPPKRTPTLLDSAVKQPSPPKLVTDTSLKSSSPRHHIPPALSISLSPPRLPDRVPPLDIPPFNKNADTPFPIPSRQPVMSSMKGSDAFPPPPQSIHSSYPPLLKGTETFPPPSRQGSNAGGPQRRMSLASPDPRRNLEMSMLSPDGKSSDWADVSAAASDIGDDTNREEGAEHNHRRIEEYLGIQRASLVSSSSTASGSHGRSSDQSPMRARAGMSPAPVIHAAGGMLASFGVASGPSNGGGAHARTTSPVKQRRYVPPAQTLGRALPPLRNPARGVYTQEDAIDVDEVIDGPKINRGRR
mmetsp:Transcript_29705/g.47932  ORF Transcript_29705/g.47932 Transcript_29705/m.47932 type:complete len:749 (+) Transcript_29705:218-2464(+)